MLKALVINDDQVLCTKTATDWLPFGFMLPLLESTVDSPAPQLGLVTLSGQDQAATCQAGVRVAVSLDYMIAHHLIVPKQTQWVSFRQLITVLASHDCQMLSEAIQLLRWQDQTRYCCRCASPVLPHDSGERAMVCPQCQLAQYPRIQPCVITIITRANPLTGVKQILLAHHHRYGSPTIDPLYGLIAGFVEVGESLEQAVHREVLEEVNIEVTNLRYFGSQPWPYPSNLMIGFAADYLSGDSDTIAVQASELSHAKFFDTTHLPKIPTKGSIAYEMIQQVLNE